MQNDSKINDIRNAKDLKTTTFSGFKKTEVKKELLKGMCESLIEPACYWGAEMVCSSLYLELWDTIILFYSRHVHIGDPMITMYLQLRMDKFKDIVRAGYVSDEISMRNNENIRKLFAEILCVLCDANKKHKLEQVKISPEYFNITNIAHKLKAPDVSYADQVFKEGDPKEIYVAINELAYSLSAQGKNVLNACFWIEWIMEYRRICSSKKQPCHCVRREFVQVDDKLQTQIEWVIWELFIRNASSHKNENVKRIITSLFSLYTLKYSQGTFKKRRYVLYAATSILTETFECQKEIIKDESKGKIKSVCSNINHVYKQIKEKEQAQMEEYRAIDAKQSSLEKSIDKLDKINIFNTTYVPRV